MASAFLSLPPPWSFGSADLKANARRFLQRALLISALVHLAAVGVFRAALERFAGTEEEVSAVVPHWSDPTILIPPFDPATWKAPTGSHSTTGVIEPRDKEVIFKTIERGGSGPTHDPVGAGPPDGAPGPGPGPGPPGPPEATPFTSVDTPPVPLVAPRPEYPAWGREARIEGTVRVRVLVGIDGIPKKAVIASGPNGLSEGVVDAVLRWRFRPGLSNGTPVEVWVEIPISFRLQE
ncbi:MAG TPA: energy transducer TonB [Candidatus Binatia bacterium]|nr:energy transducer TonB [Candidatus Binatia bacterium]